MNLPNKKFALTLCMLALLGGGYWDLQKSHAVAAENKAPPSPPAQAPDTLHFAANAPQLTFLQIQAVQTHPVPLAEALNARIAYDDNRTARVFSPIAGRVLTIRSEVGKTVRAGDPLLVLDAPDYAAAVADSAKADADLLHKKNAYERAKQLLAIQGIARKDVEAAAADLKQAEAEAQRAAARLHNLRGNVLTADGHFVLRAPLGGVISQRQVNAGSEVRPDATDPLFVITDPSHLWVLVDLPERQLDKVKVGQPVSIEVDAYPGESFAGKVDIVGDALDPVTRRFQVRCSIIDNQQKLKPEMYARVTPISSTQSDLPRIPNTALVTQGLYTYVFVELSPGVLQRRRVTLAVQDSDYSYAAEGVHAGERVVSRGALLLNSELSGQ
jgi:cobalt-zinc-cadmium efflux system membrane fusion protein